MTTGTAAGTVRAGGHVLLSAALGFGAMILLIVLAVGGVAGWQSLSELTSPSSAAVADIPADYLSLYEQEAVRYGIDWAVLAAVGKIECDHGRSEAAGCNPPGTVNRKGATGPM